MDYWAVSDLNADKPQAAAARRKTEPPPKRMTIAIG